MANVMSLVIVSLTEPDFVASAWLVAVICTAAGDGRSAGAMYTPSGDMIPSVAFPPATPFTLKLTPVSVVFVTVALNVIEFPSITEALVVVTLT